MLIIQSPAQLRGHQRGIHRARPARVVSRERRFASATSAGASGVGPAGGSGVVATGRTGVAISSSYAGGVDNLRQMLGVKTTLFIGVKHVRAGHRRPHQNLHPSGMIGGQSQHPNSRPTQAFMGGACRCHQRIHRHPHQLASAGS